jgi:hypothetical protein
MLFDFLAAWLAAAVSYLGTGKTSGGDDAYLPGGPVRHRRKQL